MNQLVGRRAWAVSCLALASAAAAQNLFLIIRYSSFSRCLQGTKHHRQHHADNQYGNDHRHNPVR